MDEAAKLAASEKDKKWEDDLWSDDEGPKTAPSTEASGDKRAADPDAWEGLATGIQTMSRKRRKPDGKLLDDLNRSLADSSEDTLRTCLSQLARVDAIMA